MQEKYGRAFVREFRKYLGQPLVEEKSERLEIKIKSKRFLWWSALPPTLGTWKSPAWPHSSPFSHPGPVFDGIDFQSGRDHGRRRCITTPSHRPGRSRCLGLGLAWRLSQIHLRRIGFPPLIERFPCIAGSRIDFNKPMGVAHVAG